MNNLFDQEIEIKKTFKPSKYQQDLFDFVELGSGNAIVGAVAGSGKTTTIQNCFFRIPNHLKMVYIAFNKSVVEEFKEKVPSYVKVCTIHALGVSSIYKNSTKGGKVVNDTFKYMRYAEKFIRKNEFIDENTFRDYTENIRRLIDLIRLNLCMSEKDVEKVCYVYGIKIIKDEISVAFQSVAMGRQNLNVIDFTDMIYLPVWHKFDVFKYDWIMVDECQDMNEASIALMKMSLKNSGRFIAIGDKRQAIYGFAGANAASFDKIKSIPNTKEFPLSVCYRCDKAIIAEAQKIVPEIQARENAGEGVITYDNDISNIKNGDLVICRNLEPLFNLSLELIKLKRTILIEGKDYGDNLIKFMIHSNTQKISELSRYLDIQSKRQIESIMIKFGLREDEAKKHKNFEEFREKRDIILAIFEGNRFDTIYEAIDFVKVIFNLNKNEDKKDLSKFIKLSTIHKSKGLEAENVWFLNEDLIPNAHATLDWEKEQEENLRYVAITRAKKKLTYINIKSNKFE